MTPDRWNQLEDLFDQLAPLGSDLRNAKVQEIELRDPELASELKTLLLYDGPGAKRVANAFEQIAGSISASGQPEAGKRIGPYTIVREIGHGGMGVVFEATRDDDQFSKRVALKLAQRSSFYPAFRERFRHERQILAQLEHPNIARLLDGGTTDDGIPYFAMEYIEGTPVDRYVRDGKLDIRQKLDLFLDICSAVEYAHQNLVVHRDIKPANILVTADGTPKLLDFGIAKLLEQNQQDSRQTQTGLAPVTPDYCSPEQLRGTAITTRTDVYLLGLLLFEILTGDRAQHADTSTPVALERSVCDTEPPRASERATSRGDLEIARKLVGDLDTIVSTAARKEPERRYVSVAQLASDVRLHLAGRPISAHADTFAYRFQKFAKRNWLPLAAAAAFSVLAVVGIGSTLYQYKRAARRFDQVRGIARTLMFDVHDSVRVLPSSVPAQQLIVNTALEYLDNLEKDAAGDVLLQTELAAGYIRMAEIQGQFALPSLDNREASLRHYRKANQILTDLNRSDGANEKVAATLVEARTGIAEWLVRSGKEEEARALLDSAIRVIQPLAEKPQASAEAKRGLAMTRMVQTRDFASGEDGERLARELVTALAAQEQSASPSTESRRELAIGYSVAGGAFLKAGLGSDAAPILEKAAEMQGSLVKIEPQNVFARRSLMLAHAKLGDLYTGPAGAKLGKREKGIASYRQMAEQAEWLYKADPSRKTSRVDYAVSSMRFGDALPAGDPRAVENLERSVRLLSEVVAGSTQETSLRRQLLDARLRLAAKASAVDGFVHAKEAVILGEALVSLEPKQEANRSLLIRAYCEVVRMQKLRGDTAAARLSAQKAVAAADSLSSVNPKALPLSLVEKIVALRTELNPK